MQQTQKEKLGRERWLQAALETLEHEGISGVRVERLAKSLGVTKGSFYWHFKDRDELLRNLLDYWREETTDSVMAEVRRRGGSPQEDLLELMRIVTSRQRAKYDTAIRAWAAFDESAAAVVREVDVERYAFARSFFEAMGFSGDELEVRTRLFYYYQLAEPSVLIQESDEERMRLLEIRHRLLVTPLQLTADS